MSTGRSDTVSTDATGWPTASTHRSCDVAIGWPIGGCRVFDHDDQLLASDRADANRRDPSQAERSLHDTLDGHRGDRTVSALDRVNRAPLDPQPSERVEMADVPPNDASHRRRRDGRGVASPTARGSRRTPTVRVPGSRPSFRCRALPAVLRRRNRAPRFEPGRHRPGVRRTRRRRIVDFGPLDGCELDVGDGEDLGHAVGRVQRCGG